MNPNSSKWSQFCSSWEIIKDFLEVPYITEENIMEIISSFKRAFYGDIPFWLEEENQLCLVYNTLCMSRDAELYKGPSINIKGITRQKLHILLQWAKLFDFMGTKVDHLTPEDLAYCSQLNPILPFWTHKNQRVH